MSQDSTASDAPSTPLGSSNEMPDHVYLVSYPKIIYLYPSVLTALFCGIFMWAKGGIPQEEIRVAGVQGQVVANLLQANQPKTIPFAKAAVSVFDESAEAPASSPTDAAEPQEFNSSADSDQPADGADAAAEPASETMNTDSAAAPAVAAEANATEPAAEDASASHHTYHNVCARIFLLVLALNLVVIAFDFPRTTSLTWFFAIVSIGIGLWFVLTLNSWLAPQIVNALLKIKPAANATFYLIYAGIMIFLFICVLVSRRFDYWEVKGNELLHHHGFLSNLVRYSAPNLRIDKEINDLFEYMLLRSGRLIIHASNERRAIVLENVLFINDKEERITKRLGALQVRVRTERDT